VSALHSGMWHDCNCSLYRHQRYAATLVWHLLGGQFTNGLAPLPRATVYRVGMSAESLNHEFAWLRRDESLRWNSALRR